MSKYKAGVLFGAELEALYNDAKDNQFAMPAVNCIGTDTINGVLETAAKVNSPVIIQFRWREEYELYQVPVRIINEGNLKNYLRDGNWQIRLESGELQAEQTFKDGVFIGGKVLGNGKMETLEGAIENMLLVHYKFFIIESLRHVESIKIEDYPFLKALFAPKGDTIAIREESASPEGGLSALYATIANNIIYPPNARRMGIEGRVYLEFFIEVDGSLSELRVVKGIGSDCDEEAIRVVKETQKQIKWRPARHEGQPVRQKYQFSIIFRLG